MNKFSVISKLCIGFISVCILAQCTKAPMIPDNSFGLPNATTSGANTFACILTGTGIPNVPLNGTFINDDNPNDPLSSVSGNGAWLNADSLTIVGVTQHGSYVKSMQFTIIGTPQQGSVYRIDSVTTSGSLSTYATCSGVSLYPTIVIADSGTIQLTKFDAVNKIVSGVFTCNFSYPQCDSTISATLGRFDYKYSSR
jgi:hypothetical protein